VGEAGKLEIDERSANGRLVLELRGELDLANAAQLDRAIAQAESADRSELLLDLSGVEFIDSTGLRSILAAHEKLGGRGGRLLVTGGQPQVARLLELTGADDYLNIVSAP